MNPRHFCRERSYHHALLLSYSFDPVFFEQIILPDLWAGRSSDILVMADEGQVHEALAAATGKLWHMGKRYLLTPARHGGAFHPKVYLRLGAKDGIVMVGSGNLTSAGWGGNRELGTSWKVGPEHADKGLWLRPFLEEAGRWCYTGLDLDALARMKSLPWLAAGAGAATDPVSLLHTRFDAPLAAQLAARWAGRRFDEVRILTGSTDEAGAFLRWAQATFGIRKATVALTPALASFDADKLADIPLEIRICAAPLDRTMHAKFYWFDGLDGASAVMGSANCSAAAWLLAPAYGGNIESVVVYDTPAATDFAAILEMFSAPTRLPADVPMGQRREPEEPPRQAPPFRLAELRWEANTRTIQARLQPRIPEDCSVTLLLEEQSLPMARSQRDDGWWTCGLAGELGAGTRFAAAAIAGGTHASTTAPRWIDDVLALEDASLASKLSQPFQGLDDPAGFAEQSRTLNELQDIARMLFDGSESSQGPAAGAADRTLQAAADRGVEPVNPRDLVCELEVGVNTLLPPGAESAAGLSLSGIVRMLFDVEERRPDPAASDGKLSGFADDLDPADTHKMPRESSLPGRDPVPIANQHHERLAAQMSAFLLNLSSKSFASTCSAGRMVQAVAFPLAVAVRGQRGGWVSPATAGQWTQAVFTIFLRGKGAGAPSLLRRVEARYAAEGRQDAFDAAVGEGTLWTVLIAALAHIAWPGEAAYLDKAVALNEVFGTPQLVAASDPQRIASLAARLRIENTRAYVGALAPRVHALLLGIEALLEELWADERQVQPAYLAACQAGELLWRKGNGWAVCLAPCPPKSAQVKVRLKGNETAIMRSFYVNVSELARRNPELAQLLRRLREVVGQPAATLEAIKTLEPAL